MVLGHAVHLLCAWWRYRACMHELSQLSDRELSDIGLTRSGIASVAWRSARSHLSRARSAPASNGRAGD